MAWADPRARLVLAYALVAVAVFLGNGAGPEGVPLVVAAFALVATTLRPSAAHRPQDAASDLASTRLAVTLVAVLALLSLGRPPGVDLRPDAARWPFVVATLALPIMAAAVAARPRLARAALAGMTLSYLVIGALLVRGSPAPHIDVFTLQTEAARFLSDGVDPYVALYTNIYSPEDTLHFFGDRRAQLPNFPYPPASLLLTAASWLLAGDVRVVLLLAQTSTALLLYRLARAAHQPPSVALGIAALHLVHPRGLFVLEQSWTEPLLGCAFVGLLVVARSSYGRAGAVAGAFLAIKQYSVLAVPLLVSGRFGLARRAWPWALAVAIAATLPLALWHPRDFLDDVLVFQMRQPLRTESLSVTGVLGSVGVRLPGAVAFAAAAGALAWAWRRLPPDRDGLCRGTALAALAFFLAGKQAFCNYYYFAGLTLLASAALAGEGATASPRR